MRLMRTWAWWAGAVVVLAGAVGCEGQMPVYPVRGKVLFAGKPMKGGGSISFVPLTNVAGKTAGGDIAEDGTYSLRTHTAGDGSMVGEFRVVINQVVEKEPENTGDGHKAAKAVTVVAPADRIPDVYGDSYNSPLRARVEAKANEIDFDLKRP